METLSERRLDFLEARYERHCYVKECAPEYTDMSKDSIAFPAILLLQRIVSSRDKRMLEKTCPVIKRYYDLTKFTSGDVMKFGYRKGVWYLLANVSPLLSARVRCLLKRPF